MTFAIRPRTDRQSDREYVLANLETCVSYLESLPVRESRRKPQDATRWPPSLSKDDIEKRIDDLCGCQAKRACNCVSVFSQACSQAWYDHNTRDKS